MTGGEDCIKRPAARPSLDCRRMSADAVRQRQQTAIGGHTPAVDKAIRSLLRRGLATELDISDGSEPLPTDHGQLIDVQITAAGRAAIDADPAEEDPSSDEPEDNGPPVQAASSRPTSKIGTVLSLLQRKEGAILDEMVAATGWLPHTTRAALTALRKKGHAITKDKRGDMTCYHITAEA